MSLKPLTSEEFDRIYKVRERISKEWWFKKEHGRVEYWQVDMVFLKLMDKYLKNEWPVQKLAPVEKKKVKNETDKFFKLGYDYHDWKYIFGVSDKCILMLQVLHEFMDDNTPEQIRIAAEIWKLQSLY